jgi:hypothetical protein
MLFGVRHSLIVRELKNPMRRCISFPSQASTPDALSLSSNVFFGITRA